MSLHRRVIAIGVACGMFGVIVMVIAYVVTARGTGLRINGPVLAWQLAHGERARCEAAPQTWSLVGPLGAVYFAYDGDTLRAANSEAPVFRDDLRGELDEQATAVVLDGLGRGGVVALRVAAHGPCAVITAHYQTVYSRAQLAAYFAGCGLIAGLLGAAIGAIASARPLRELAVAHRAIRDQIADVAHDVRTPIASLQLALEQAIAAAGEPEAVAACLVRAVHDVVYVGGLVDNLRLAAELRAGAPGATTVCRLGELVEHAALRAQFFARQHAIALDVAVPDPGDSAALSVDGDPIAIAQAVGNIIDNAIAHNEPHGHVAIVLEPDGATGFALTVVDDGPGVSATELPRLGERTFRSDAARERDARGRGLGLAITAAVCERMGWTLAIAHEQPRGLRVTIRGEARRPR